MPQIENMKRDLRMSVQRGIYGSGNNFHVFKAILEHCLRHPRHVTKPVNKKPGALVCEPFFTSGGKLL